MTGLRVGALRRTEGKRKQNRRIFGIRWRDIDLDIETLRFWLEKLPNPWPTGLRVLPELSTEVEKKSRIDLTTPGAPPDTQDVRLEINAIMQSEAMGPMTARASLTNTGPEGLSLCSANPSPIGSDQRGNGHWRPENFDGLNIVDQAALALSLYVRNRLGDPRKEIAHVHSSQSASSSPHRDRD